LLLPPLLFSSRDFVKINEMLSVRTGLLKNWVYPKSEVGSVENFPI